MNCTIRCVITLRAARNASGNEMSAAAHRAEERDGDRLGQRMQERPELRAGARRHHQAEEDGQLRKPGADAGDRNSSRTNE